MENEQWTLKIGKWAMTTGNGQYEMENGKWEMEINDGRWEVVWQVVDGRWGK